MSTQKEKEITLSTIEAYKQWLTQERGVALRTMAHYLIVLRLYMTWRKKNKYPYVDPSDIELPKNSTVRKVEFVSEQDIADMVSICTTDTQRAIIITLFDTGLRLGELLSLRVSDILAGNREIAITGKGDKTRPIFLSPRALSAMKKVVGERTDGRVFQSSPRAVQSMVHDIGYRALDRQITPHTIRHGFATRMLGKGVDIRIIQEFLGHASISTTMMYTHITNKQLKDIHSALIK